MNWLRKLFRPSRDQSPTSTGVVSKARSEAYAAVKDAEARNDTRDLGRALMRLRQATTEELTQAIWP